jgi:hypothetical protein
MDVEKTLQNARLILTSDDSGKLVCLIKRQPGDVVGHFGIALADCARHVAKAFGVGEDEVFDWIERERQEPSSKLQGTSGSVQ